MSELKTIYVIESAFPKFTRCHVIAKMNDAYDRWRAKVIELSDDYHVAKTNMWRGASLSETLYPGYVIVDEVSANHISIGVKSLMETHPGWMIPQSIVTSLMRTNIEGKIVPKPNEIFLPLTLDPRSVRAIIVGQDPYPFNSRNQVQNACGYCFAQPHQAKESPSYSNIVECMKNDGLQAPGCKCLQGWRDQGVLMINACPIYVHGREEIVTNFDTIMHYIVARACALNPKIPVALVGRRSKDLSGAASKGSVLQVSHPSTRNEHSAQEFCRSGLFRKINEILAEHHRAMIDFSLKTCDH